MAANAHIGGKKEGLTGKLQTRPYRPSATPPKHTGSTEKKAKAKGEDRCERHDGEEKEEGG